MAKRIFQAFALIALLSLAGTVTVLAAGAGASGDGGDEAAKDAGLLQHIHEMIASHLHSGHHGSHGGHHGGHHDHGEELIQELGLTSEQQERLAAVQSAMAAYHEYQDDSMEELHERLMEQVRGLPADAQIPLENVHAALDAHYEEGRELAYTAVDGAVALLNDLDATQRDALLNLFGHGGY